MPEHPNAVIARRLFEALASGDAPTALPLIATDAVWRFPGRRGKLAGNHEGREAIVRFLTSVMTLTNGTFHLEIEDIAASDDNAVVLFTGHGQREGKTLDNPTSLRVRIQNGLVTEFQEFVWDLGHVEEFWS